MKLGIMQPYFFPYIGYFQLINIVDQFILFDTSQFIRHGWIERNRILKQNGAPLFIRVPMRKHSRSTPINRTEINNDLNWKSKILAQLDVYKKKSPYYRGVIEILDESFSFNTNSIVELNQFILKIICRKLKITTPIKIYSKMALLKIFI